MIKAFAFSLLLLFAIWGGLLLHSPHGHQRHLFALDRSTFYTDYLYFRDAVMLPDMYEAKVGHWRNSYPAIALEILRPFENSRGGALSFMLVSGCLFFVALFWLAGSLGLNMFDRMIVTCALAVSWISLRTVERGNSIFVSAALVCVFLAWFRNEVKWKRAIAAVALGASAAIKISPAFLGLLYFMEPIADGNWRKRYDWLNIWLCAFVAVGLVVAPFFIWCNGFESIGKWIDGIRNEAEGHFSPWCLQGVRCALNLLVHKGAVAMQEVAPPLTENHCKIVTAVLGLIPLGMLALSGVYRRCFTKSDRLFFLVVAMLVLCMNSMFYVGVLLFPALVMWLKEVDDGEERFFGLNAAQLGLWLILLMPIQIVIGGKTMQLSILFVATWALTLVRSLVCLKRAKGGLR